MNLRYLDNNELISLYGNIVKDLKERNIIRTKNVLGDLGEYLVMRYYNDSKDLPNIYLDKTSSKNIDARSDKYTYSIKSTTTGTTSAIRDSKSNPNEKLFDYIVICKFGDNYQLEAIYELSWEMFLKHRHWHKRMNAWQLSITKDLARDAKKIYKTELCL